MSDWEYITQWLSALERRVQRLERLNGVMEDSSTAGKQQQSTFSDAQRAAFYQTLNKQEQAIVRLVCQCLNNESIGETLFISKGTVANHLTTVYNKLQYCGIDGIVQADRNVIIRFFGDYFERCPDDDQSGNS